MHPSIYYIRTYLKKNDEMLQKQDNAKQYQVYEVNIVRFHNKNQSSGNLRFSHNKSFS